MPKILVVDDTKAIADIVEQILSKNGYDIIKASNGTEAIKAFQSETFDLVITDMLMPQQDGYDVIHHLKQSAPGTKIIVMTGGGVTITPAEVIRSVGEDIEVFLTKPISKSDLLNAVEKAMAA